MASPTASDFLTKEIKVSGNLVTFRLLSRQLSIHINDAKRELELYHTAAQRSKDPVFATYLLSGAAAPETNTEGGDASVGGGLAGVPRHLIILVPEDGLEAAKDRFDGVPAQHVYSLSPVPLKDHGLLASITERVRTLDLQKGQNHAAGVGMLQSKEATWPGSSNNSPKSKPITSTTPKSIPPIVKAPTKIAKPELPSKAETNVARPLKEPARQSSLNFGASTKNASINSKKGGSGVVVKQDEIVGPKPVPSRVDHQQAFKEKASSPLDELPVSKNTSPSSAGSVASKQVQRPTVQGGRAKRILDSSDEEEPIPAQQRPAFKRKKSHATSDDDDDSSGYQAPIIESASLKAMMDVDDDGVVNGRRARSATPEHVLSAREVAAAAKAAKAEAKAAKAEALKGVDHKEPSSRKRVPKGKRRVMKTRRVKNAKGYMVTEDYSSYEDIDPNETDKNDSGVETEPDREQNVGKKLNVQKTTSTGGSMRQRQSELSNTSKKAKSSASAKPGQQKLASFFGKK